MTPLLPRYLDAVAHETQTYEVLDGEFAGTTGGNTLTFFSTDFDATPELPPQPLGAPWHPADPGTPAARIIVDGAGSLIEADQFAIGESFTFDNVALQWVESGLGGRSGAIIRNGGRVKAERILIGKSGVLRGNDGTLEGAVENRGTIMPGESPGTLNIVGDYTQTQSGLPVIEIGGTAPGTFDVLDISGKATLGGTLKIELVVAVETCQEEMSDIPHLREAKG